MKTISLSRVLFLSAPVLLPLMSACSSPPPPEPSVEAARPTAATAGRTAPYVPGIDAGPVRALTAAQIRNEQGPVISLGNGASLRLQSQTDTALASAAAPAAAPGTAAAVPPQAAVQSTANGAARTYWPQLDRRTRVQLPPAAVIPPQESRQLLDIQYGNLSQGIEVLFRADGQRLLMAGSAPLGIRLFTARYDSSGIHTSMLVEFKGLPRPEQVLLDVMLALAPADSWKSVLPQGYALTDRGNQRMVTDSRGNTITVITYSEVKGRRQPVRLDNRTFGYQIGISCR